MEKCEKLFRTILDGKSDANINFNEDCNLLKRVGFEERVCASPHLLRKADVEEKLNLQKDGNKAFLPLTFNHFSFFPFSVHVPWFSA